MATSDGSGGERRRVLTIKDISTKNAQQLRHDALRLVSEGVVHLEVDANASYERQGNMAYYSEENLARRLAIRNHPLLQRLTCALWRLVCQSSSPMDYDGYTTLLIRLHKILMEHFDADMSYVQIRQDWDSDTKGHHALAYGEFHLALFELVDLWCDSIHVEDYISLLYLILEGITRVENSTFQLRPLQDILYTDVVDVALQRSLHDIESIMATMIIEPVDVMADGSSYVAAPTQVGRKRASGVAVEPKKEMILMATEDQRSADTVAGADYVATSVRDLALPTNGSPLSSTTAEPPTGDSHIQADAPSEPSDCIVLSINRHLHLDSPPRPLAMDDCDRHLLTSLPSLAPWGNEPPMLPRENSTSKTTPHQTSSDSSLPLLQSSAQATGTSNKASTSLQKHASTSRLVTDSQRPVASTESAQGAPSRVYAPVKKETQPLEQRDFGGFNIKSSREVAQPAAPPKPTVESSVPPASSFAGIFTTATLPEDKMNENRIEEIRKAFQEKKRLSFVRKRTPPRLGILDTKPPVGAPAPPSPTDPPAKDVPLKAKRKATEFQKESVGLVTALASSTLGAVLETHSPRDIPPINHRFRTRQMASDDCAPQPLHDIQGIVAGNLQHFTKPPSHDMVELAAKHLAIVSQLPPRPSGATKHMLPRRHRGPPNAASEMQVLAGEIELRVVQVPNTPQRTPQEPVATHATLLPRLVHRPTPPQPVQIEQTTTLPIEFGVSISLESKNPLLAGIADTATRRRNPRILRGHLYQAPAPVPGLHEVTPPHDGKVSLPAIHPSPRLPQASTSSKGLDEARPPSIARPANSSPEAIEGPPRRPQKESAPRRKRGDQPHLPLVTAPSPPSTHRVHSIFVAPP